MSTRLLQLLVVPVLMALGVTAAAAPRPNILIIFADDWGRHAGAYAQIDGPGGINDAVRTPNFDRVAREGVLFRNAFVSSPSCTPCRSALLSGQHFWRTGRGAILRGAQWDASIPAFPLLLRDSGYHIGESYKVWGPGTPNDAPYGGGKYAYEKAGWRFNNFSEHVTELVAGGTGFAAARDAICREVMGNFEAFLADRGAGQPFCYWFGPTNTHRMWEKGSGRALWGLDPDALAGKLPPYLPDVPEVREDVTDYIGEILALDHALGLFLARLEAMGELDNTVVVVSGDHGAPGFPHGKCNLYAFGAGVPLAVRWGGAHGGRVVDDLTSLTDLAPTFLELAGIAAPSVMTGRSLMPLLATSQSGRIDQARDAVFIGRERHVENARAGYLPYPQRAIRTHEFLYIVNFHPERYPLGDPYNLDAPAPARPDEVGYVTRTTLPDEDAGPTKAWLVAHRKDPAWEMYFKRAYGLRPREELYDLAADPHQMRNLAGDPAYAVTRAALEGRLMAELRETGDPRVVGAGEYFETPPLAGPLRNTPEADQERPRLAVLTDIGGDPDDQQSMIRLMAYANAFEIEALIASASGTRGELKKAITRPELIHEIISAYGEVLPNLRRHAEGWPSAEQLHAVVRSGNRFRERDYIGAEHDTEGSRYLIERVDAGTPKRPLNVTVWGGQTDLAQALWRVKHDRGEADYREFARRLRVYDINDQDGIAAWMRAEFPGLHYVLASAPPGADKRQGTYRGMYLGGDESLTSRTWIDAHVRSTGPLGALYPVKTWTAPNPHACLKEGDTPAWFFFLPFGGNDPANPALPGWGGQFQRMEDGWWQDLPGSEAFDPRSTVSNWRADYQADFARRMQWCLPE